MRRPAISPHDPKVVLLGCDMTGGYVTGDGGASLADGQLRLGADRVRLRPGDARRPSTPGAEAVYRSDDSGRTWRMVLPDPAKNTVAKAIGDHGDRVFFTDDPVYPGSGRSVTIHAIAVDEDDPARVFVAASAADSPVAGHAGLADPPPRLDRRRAHVVAGRRLRLGARLRAPGERRRKGAHGCTPSPRPARTRARGPPGSTSRLPAAARFTSGSLGRDPRSGVVFAYATLPLGAEPGRDRRWRPGVRGRRTDLVARRTARCSRPCATPAAATSGDRPRAHAHPWGRSRSPLASRSWPTWACAGFVLPGRGDAPFNGIARTTDGGRTWSVVHAESDRAVGQPRGVLDRAARRRGRALRLVRLPLRPRRWRRTTPTSRTRPTSSATYRTTDGGKTWAQVNSERARRTTAGRPAASTSRPPTAIQFDPHDPQRVFIPYTDIGLFRSEDGGETWTGSSTGIPRAGATRPTGWRSTPR